MHCHLQREVHCSLCKAAMLASGNSCILGASRAVCPGSSSDESCNHYRHGMQAEQDAIREAEQQRIEAEQAIYRCAVPPTGIALGAHEPVYCCNGATIRASALHLAVNGPLQGTGGAEGGRGARRAPAQDSRATSQGY